MIVLLVNFFKLLVYSTIVLICVCVTLARNDGPAETDLGLNGIFF